METNPSQRLKVARDALGLKLREFAAPLRRSHQTISDWETGRTPIPLIVAEAIEKHHGISSEWLLAGEGEMLCRKVDNLSSPGTDVIVPMLLMAHASAGKGNSLSEYVDATSGMKFDALWLRRAFGVQPANLCLIEVDGDSMLPTIYPNDIVFVDGLRKTPDYRDGIWVLRMGGLLFVKRVHRLPHNKYQITSDNPVYGPLEPDESTQLLGRVVGGGHPKRY